MKILRILKEILAILLLIPAALFPFGKNKVQYEKLVWNYHDLQYVESYFHQNQGTVPIITANWVLKDYEDLSYLFNYNHNKKVPLIVMGSPTLFEQTNVISGIIPEGVGGFTESIKNRIVIPFTGDYAEFRHVLRHELVHAFQFGVLFENTSQALMRGGSAQFPLWFAEGLAEFLSSSWDNEADMFLMDAVINSEIPMPGASMRGYFAYKGGQSFFFYLWNLGGKDKFLKMLDRFRITKKPVSAIEEVYDLSIEELGTEWIKELKRIYWPEIGHRPSPDLTSKSIIDFSKSRSRMNLKPRISKSGDKIAFYSDLKDNTGIIITDGEGKKIDYISQFSNGGFFDSFQPFRSGFSFSPDGTKIAFITKDKGRNDIRIRDLTTKKIIQQIRFQKLSAISSLDWSPEGKYLLLTGLNEDRNDIYEYNLETKNLTRLTNSIYNEQNPRYSPTGESILFSMCDTSGSFELNTEYMKPQKDLYEFHRATKKITQITKTTWNEKDAAYSPDGNHIVFVSDMSGIYNLYIMKINSSEEPKFLTNYIGFCSTPDWSKESNEIVFTHFYNQKWHIRKIDNPIKKAVDKTPVKTVWQKFKSGETKNFFIPENIPVSKLKTVDNEDTISIEKTIHKKDTLHNDEKIREIDTSSTDIQRVNKSSFESTTDSLNKKNASSTSKDERKNAISINISTDTLPSNKYKLKFQPDALILGLAFNSMYGYGGQGAISFSDLLGNHQLVIAANIQGTLKETGLYLSYLNSKYRIDFGGAFFLDRYYAYANFETNNVEHKTTIGFNTLIRFPLSVFNRIDISFLFKSIIDIPQTTENGKFINHPDSTNKSKQLITPSISHVYDNILWGITGPVRGVRSKTNFLFQPPTRKTEAAFVSLDSDIRHYLHIGKKFVWANRITAGFSEPLGNKPRERKYFLGGNDYWLFYYLNRDSYLENYSNTAYSSHVLPFRGWNYFDITGTRFAVINTEFRFPFVKEINLVWPLPLRIKYINGALFADIGNAWEPEDQLKKIPLPRKLYGGIGTGLRINLGIFVLRYDAAWKTNWSTYVKGTKHYWSLGAEF